MKRIRLLLALTATLILGAVAWIAAAQPTVPSDCPFDPDLASLEGQVLDALTQRPLAYANVVLVFEDDESIVGVTTDTDGRFRFACIEPGVYRLRVVDLGHVDYDESVTLVAGRSTPVICTLAAANLRDLPVARPTKPQQGLLEEALDGKVHGRQWSPAGQGPAHRATESRATHMVQSLVRSAPGMADFDEDSSVSDEALLSRLGDADELWVITRPSGPLALEDDLPRSGCLLVERPNESGELVTVPSPLEHTKVRARIDGWLAAVTMEQRFGNPFTETIEAEYVFPLPVDAAVHDFEMQIGDRIVRGVIREKEDARRIYDEAVRRGHVASLLEQQRPNVFRQRVGNIEPGHSIEVRLQYAHALPYHDGELVFHLPTVVGPRYNPPGSTDGIGAVPRGNGNSSGQSTTVEYLGPNERTGHDIDIEVMIDAGVPIEDLRVLDHAVEIEHLGDNVARVRLSSLDRIPNRDFVLHTRVAADAIRSVLQAAPDAEGDSGVFSLLLLPPAELRHLQRAPVEFVFVLDCSGSMNGRPMEIAKNAIRRSLRQLKPQDSFQVIRFSESATQLGPQPLPATAFNVEKALRYVSQLQGGGGTQMIEGIKASLRFEHDPRRLRLVTFMTDGYIGNENEILAAIARDLGDARIFSFGVGSSVNRHLLEGMARLGKGAVAYLGQDDDHVAIDSFFERIQHPALTDLRVDFGDLKTDSVYPSQVLDLFVGRPVRLLGRYEGELPKTIKLRGSLAGVERSYEVPVQVVEDVKSSALTTLWARRHIADLEDQLLVNTGASAERLKETGLEVALAHGLLSTWTSYVAVDEGSSVEEPATRIEGVPVEMPEGVRHGTTLGGERN